MARSAPAISRSLRAIACIAALVGLRVFGATPASIQLTDVTRQANLPFVHSDGSSGQRYIVETVASGLALFDYDGDGDVDLFFLSGTPLPGTPITNPPPRNALYRNDGHWKFTDVTAAARLGTPGYGLGVCTGDYDNDGDQDIYLSNFGPNILYRNNGDGTFSDVTLHAGVAIGPHVGAGAAFLDIDGDGDLDLFAASYVDFTFASHQISHMSGFPAYVGPLQYPPTASHLFRNHGDGTFTDISTESGIAAHLGSGMGVIATDYDNDGDADILVGNDLRPNFLFQNDGKGRFREIGVQTGFAYNALGQVQGSMGVEVADWNHDGWLDAYISTYQRQLSTLYQNQAGVALEDVTRQSGAGTDTYPHVAWGVGFVDFDNDTHRDLFVACGHLIDNIEQFDDTTRYRARNLLLQNTGRGRFVNVSDRAGSGLLPELSSRGAAFDDLDGDGRIDAVIQNSRAAPTLLRNDSPATNHWLQIKLRGTKANRDGIGARVEVTTDSLTQIDEVHGGRSYQSDFGRRLHFGLGNRTKVASIRVRWPGGTVDVLHDVRPDCLLDIVEGSRPENPSAPAPKTSP